MNARVLRSAGEREIRRGDQDRRAKAAELLQGADQRQRAIRSAAATSVSNNVSRPAEGSSAKAMMFSSVVFPAPAAPVRKQNSPASSVSEISDKTATPAP